MLLAAALAAGGCGSIVTGGDNGDGGSGGSGPTTTGTPSPPTTGSTPSTTAAGGALGDCVYGSGAGSTGSSAICNGFYNCDAGAAVVVCADDGGGNTYCNCFLDQQLMGSCSEGIDCMFPGSCCKALLDGDIDPVPRSFGACQSDASTGSTGSGNSYCHQTFQCDGGQASIECGGPVGGPASCDCRDGTYTLLGTCDQAGVDCDYEGSCCWTILNP